jgi:hypothetical protein
VVVFTVNVALVAPAGIVTLDGTEATDALLGDSVTTILPAGAGALCVTVPVEESPPFTLVGFKASAGSVRLEFGVGVGVAPPPYGCTVSVADFVTPAPVTETVTSCCVVTETLMKMLKPPVVAPAGIVTALVHVATDGLLHVTGSVRSDTGGDATVTVAKEPFDPVVGFGLSVSETGACCGVSVTCDWRVAPLRLALKVTTVFVVTALVGIFTETDESPAAMVAVAGGLAAEELLERFTTVPPAGAAPDSITISVGCAPPPVMVLGAIVSDLSPGGCTINVTDADVELSDAESVTAIGEDTCPT